MQHKLDSSNYYFLSNYLFDYYDLHFIPINFFFK